MTTIEWTHRPGTKGETWNPIRARNRETGGVGHYCAHVSEGCRNCYAETMQGWRFNNPIRFAAQDIDQVEIFLDAEVLIKPLRWRQPRTIFVCSMTDLYGPWVPDTWLDKIKAIEALTPQHTYIELTKRPERMGEYIANHSQARCDGRGEAVVEIDPTIPLESLRWPLPNVWEGTSVEDNDTAQARIRELQKVPAAVRWISFEPMLGPVDYTFFDRPAFWKGIHWAVAGGESGRGARPMHPDWPRWVRDRCRIHGVAFFFKQWGKYRPYREGECTNVITEVQPDGRCRATDIMNPTGALMVEVGKKAAGRMLDGVEWTMWPEVFAPE